TCGSNDLQQSVTTRRDWDPRSGHHLAGHGDRVDRALLDDHQRLRLERLPCKTILNRLLDFRRQTACGRNTAAIGHADRAVGPDLLIWNDRGLATARRERCLG